MPLRIEFIDTEQNIRTLLPLLQELVTDGADRSSGHGDPEGGCRNGSMKLRCSLVRVFAGSAMVVRRPVGAGLRRPCRSWKRSRLPCVINPRIASAELAAQASGYVVSAGSIGLLSDALRQCHRCRHRARFGSIGRRRDHVEHLQPSSFRGGCQSTIDRFRAHRQSGAERQAAHCIPKSERDEYARSGAGRGAGGILSSARHGVGSQSCAGDAGSPPRDAS